MKGIIAMKIFAPEKLSALCIDYSDFILFKGTSVSFPDKDSEIGRSAIAQGEKYLDYLPTVLPLSDFRRFVEDGDRVSYETPYFVRRDALLYMTIAEMVENEGRFMRKICDILWCILEESTWVIPAHYYSEKRGYGKTAPVPYDYDEACNIDLFSSATGALIAMVYYLLGEKLSAEADGLVTERLLYELDKKIVKPYKSYTNQWWRRGTNNWNPWIASSLLTVAAIVCKDIEDRRYFIEETFKSLNFWIDGYGADGGCDEGPGYWFCAGGCLFDCLELLYDMTGGQTEEWFTHPLVVKICDFVRSAHICDGYKFNCSDAHPFSKTIYFSARFYERLGKRTGNELLRAYGNSCYYGKKLDNPMYFGTSSSFAVPYRHFANIIFSDNCAVPYKPLKCDVLPDMQFVAMRSEREEASKLYLGIKGGHNDVPHNHNDVGNYVLYSDGKPVIIDIGVGTYTKFTFNEMRYKMHFNFRSDGHNLPIICGLTQGVGRDFEASSFDFDEGTSTIRIGLEKAYEDKEGVIESYVRSAKMSGDYAEITDEISLTVDGDVQFLYYTPSKPKAVDGAVELCENTVLTLSENDGVEIEEIEFDDAALIKDWGESIFKITVKSRSNAGKITMRSKFTKK